MNAKLLLAIFCLCFTIKIQAKNHETYDSIIATDDTLTVENKHFPIMQDANGFRFIQAKKQNGKPYQVPIWRKTKDKFEGQDIYIYKNNGYFYYGISRHGYPCYIWLNKERR